MISHREPNPDEARIQAMSVIAACAKGLMYFQSEVSIINIWTFCTFRVRYKYNVACCVSIKAVKTVWLL